MPVKNKAVCLIEEAGTICAAMPIFRNSFCPHIEKITRMHLCTLSADVGSHIRRMKRRTRMKNGIYAVGKVERNSDEGFFSHSCQPGGEKVKGWYFKKGGRQRMVSDRSIFSGDFSMKRILTTLITMCLLLTGCGNSNYDKAREYLTETYHISYAETIPKVILDCDMTYLGDDAMCLSILAQADKLGLIDLLGITITGGNNFVSYGTNSALVQLEKIGREDIPVYAGTDIPLNGVRDLNEQAAIIGSIDKWGAMYHFDEYIEPENYHNLGKLYERKWGYSETEAEGLNSVDFMIQQVTSYPNEVTLISVGSATNIASACLKDDHFASKAAGIVYMGTIIGEQGTYTPYADFNCFYDAEAYDICLSSDFPVQLVIPHEASKTAVLNKAVFDLLDSKSDTLAASFWLENQYSQYRRNSKYKQSCPDAIAAVCFLNPNVIVEQDVLRLKVNTDVDSPYYGQVTSSREDGNINVVLAVDDKQYWDFVTDLLCEMTEKSDQDYSYYIDYIERSP